MKQFFSDINRPQFIAAVVFIILLVACGTTDKLVKTYRYGEKPYVSYNKKELELLSRIDPLAYPLKSDELYFVAFNMAKYAEKYSDSDTPDRFLESVLLNSGIYDRSAACYWYRGKEGDNWFKKSLKELKDNDYHQFSLAVIEDKSGFSAAIVATRKSFFLKSKLPIYVKVGEELNFQGSINDDLGMLKVVIMEPDGIVFEDYASYLAGDFDYTLAFTKEGLYKVEFLNSGLDGDFQTIARFGFRVETHKIFRFLSSSKNTDKENFSSDMLDAINRIRLKENKQKLESFEFLEDIIRESSATEAEKWPSSINIAQHPLTINLKHKLSCVYISSHTKTLGVLMQKNMEKPSYRKAVLEYSAFTYQAAVQQSGEGFRVSELICSPYYEKDILLGRYQSAHKQQQYQEIRQQRLAELLGFNNGSNLEKISENWQLVQSFKLIDNLGGLKAILKGKRLNLENRRGSLTGEQLNISELLDEAFVSVWQILQQKQNGTGVNNPEKDALSLLLFQILLFQNRIDDYALELERLTENRNLSNLWLNARVQLAAGWLEAYRGNYAEALKFLGNAQRTYRSLKMDSTVQNVARQRMILNRKSASAR